MPEADISFVLLNSINMSTGRKHGHPRKVVSEPVNLKIAGLPIEIRSQSSRMEHNTTNSSQKAGSMLKRRSDE
jgi:hypothetical protein